MTTEAHVHHWLIASPSGATSHGVCLLCGAQRSDFKNGPLANKPHESGWATQNNAKKRLMRQEYDAEMEQEPC